MKALAGAIALFALVGSTELIAQKVTVSEIDLRGAETIEQQSLIKNLARSYLEEAINNPKFQNRLRGLNGEQKIRLSAARYRSETGKSSSLCREDIWKKIQAGEERSESTDGKPADRKIGLQIVLVPKRRPTVGSTVLGRYPIRTGYWFINAAAAKNDAISVARHFMHEWLHVVGFYHYPSNSARGDVPYALGELVRDILKDKNVRLAAIENVNKGAFGPKFSPALADFEEDPVISSMLDDAEDEPEVGVENYKGAAEVLGAKELQEFLTCPES